MSTPLTDSINALTTYANEVTGASDTNLSDAVHTLASGYGQGGVNYLDYASHLSEMFVNSQSLPPIIEFSPIKLDSGNVNGDFISSASMSSAADGKIELSVHFVQTTSFALNRFLFGADRVKKLKLTGNLNLCTSYINAFQSMNGLEDFDALLDFTSCTSRNTCILNSSSDANTLLSDMRFAPNTCRQRLDIIGFGALSDDSIVSAANCLIAGVSGQRIRYYSTQKARCSTLMGNNENGTFVIDENGTMTLADFITNVKGWMLE